MHKTTNYVLRFDQLYKGNYLKIVTIFVSAIKFRRLHLFQNRFHRWSTLWPYFPRTSIIVRAIMPKTPILAIMGIMARINYAHKLGKYCQNVDHQWKRFWKKFILRKFLANTKIVTKMDTIPENRSRTCPYATGPEKTLIYFWGVVGPVPSL